MLFRNVALFCVAAVFAGCVPEEMMVPVEQEGLLPPPERGYQINLGPFDVPPRDETCNDNGTLFFEGNCGEIQLCRTFKLDNEEPIAIDRIDVAITPGSHHFILFRSEMDFPDLVFPCWGTVNFDIWEFMVDVNKAGGHDWQLDEGQAFVLEPHQQLMVQTHFVNAGTVKAPDGGMVTTNLHQTDLSDVEHELHGKFVVNNTLYLPPHEPSSFTRRCTFNRSVGVVAVTGHFHERGTEFAVEHVSRESEAVAEESRGQMYYNDNWDSPEFTVYEEPWNIYEGQGVRFDCSYFNNTDKPIGYGGHADSQEHCNLFFQYYKLGAADELLECIDGPNGK